MESHRAPDASKEVQETVVGRIRSDERRETAERLHQTLRRLGDFKHESDWVRTLLEGTRPFAGRAAFFRVGNDRLRALGARGSVSPETPESEIELLVAPAFQNAVESCETVIALRRPSEISLPIARWLGESPEEKCYLFPLEAAGRVVGILYAEPADLRADPSALEILAHLAGLALATGNARPSSNMVTIRSAARSNGQSGSASKEANPNTTAGQPPSPDSGWAALSKQEQELHLRAQRFARVRVAEMRLYHSPAVEAGRIQRSLYAGLRTEIDVARRDFRDRFFDSCPSMVDYLHVELMRTLALDDDALLGPEYPGPMT